MRLKPLLAILLASVVLIVGITVFMSESIAEQRARQIEIGMTMEQVEAVLEREGTLGVFGTNKTATGMSSDWYYSWDFDDAWICVVFHMESHGGMHVASKEVTRRYPLIIFLRNAINKVGLIRI